ncbi:MAG: ComF family protein [Rikenellaceae bacterium]|jgi:ComF family protein|nr:ComF family protein [Rikenellaceae bacterium]
MSILSDLGHLFFPPVCPACGGPLGEGARTVCTACRWDAPLTGFWAEADNPVARKFWGHFPIVQASSLLFFSGQGGFRQLIHAFKYCGGWRLAVQMGEWYGALLAGGGLYNDVDVVVPVPLHFTRRVRRGYNQSQYIAEGIAKALKKPLDTHTLRRSKNNRSQARIKGQGPESAGRWTNVQGIFAVRRPEKFEGRHILLVDDVLTTGATLASCAEAILAAAPGARISIATLAVARHDLK